MCLSPSVFVISHVTASYIKMFWMIVAYTFIVVTFYAIRPEYIVFIFAPCRHSITLLFIAWLLPSFVGMNTPKHLWLWHNSMTLPYILRSYAFQILFGDSFFQGLPSGLLFYRFRSVFSSSIQYSIHLIW